MIFGITAWNRRYGLWILAMLLFPFLLNLNGCQKAKVSEDEWATMSALIAGIDHAQKAVDFASTDTQFNRIEFEDKVITSLNRWSVDRTEQKEDADWKRDPLVAKLSQEFQDMRVVHGIDDNVFDVTDAQFLKQSSWMKSVIQVLDDGATVNIWPPIEQVNFERQNEADDPLATALKAKHSELDEQQSRQLASCLRYFDWTIRTIQLDKLHDNLTQEEIDAEKLVLDAEPGTPLPLMGVAGPGYRRFPWQTMLYGRGDFLNRTRVFIGLCHQQGIDVVLLATRKDDDIVPWLPAAMIGDHLFLFDPLLGLPIPGNDDRIATWKDVNDDPGILKRLDLTGEEYQSSDRAYRVQADDLGNMIALIDASPAKLSRRMFVLERTLSGDRQLLLSVDPSKIQQRVVDAGIKEVQLWDVPFKVHQFRTVLNTAKKNANFDDRLRPRVARQLSEEVFVDNYLLFRTAKTRFMQGLFDTPRGSPKYSCIRLFADMRYTEEEIINVTNNEFILQALNVRVPGQSQADFSRRIANVRGSMRQIRVDAAYFLGVANFEAGSPSTAINWFSRVADFQESGRWDNGIKYMTARSHEAIGEFDKAIAIYQADTSPQVKGNLVRVRMLKADNFKTTKSNDDD